MDVSVYTAHLVAKSASSVGETRLNDGGRVLLPYTVLDEISKLRMVYPLQFKIFTPTRTVYAAVLEFNAEVGVIVIPDWMFSMLHIVERGIVNIATCNLDAGTLIKLRPHKTEFVQLSDPRHVLEQRLVNYPILFRGATIVVRYAANEYKIDVTEIFNTRDKPVDAVLTARADAQATELKVEFERPLDSPPTPPDEVLPVASPNIPYGANFHEHGADDLINVDKFQFKPPSLLPHDAQSEVKVTEKQDADEDNAKETFRAFTGEGHKLQSTSAGQHQPKSEEDVRQKRLAALLHRGK